MEIHIGDRVAEIELVSKEDNKVVLTIDGKPFEADVVMAENGTCNILMDGRSANAQLIRRENGKSYKVNTHHFPNAGKGGENPCYGRAGNENGRYRHRHRSHEDAEQLQSDFRLPHQGNSGSGRRQHHR